MAKYKLSEPENLSSYEQLARISFNLRHFSKIWKEHYGATNRSNMQYWEDKLDIWLNKNVEPVYNEDSEEIFKPNQSWAEIHPKQNKAI